MQRQSAEYGARTAAAPTLQLAQRTPVGLTARVLLKRRQTQQGSSSSSSSSSSSGSPLRRRFPALLFARYAKLNSIGGLAGMTVAASCWTRY